MEKKKKILIIVLVITLILIITISTTALWKWTSGNSNVGFTISGLDAYIIYNKGSDVLTGVLDPVASYSQTGVSTEITLYKNTSKTLYGHIYLDVTAIGANIANEPAVKWVITSNGEVLNEGNFVGSSVGDSIPLKINIPLSTTEQKFQIYIWLDESMSINDAIEGETLSTIVRAEASEVEYEIEPNSPDLVQGLVPITYSEDKWVKADSSNTNNSWYNYSNKQWANAVLVTSDYRDANNKDTFDVGDEVPEDAILAYYVWIPRYKYKVWNINKEIGTDSYDAQNTGIDIKWESGTESTGTIDCTTTPYSFAAPTETTTNEKCTGSNGDYYTHPAFWWDNNGNNVREESEEVRGVWVGKFEISTPSDSTCYSNTTFSNCSNTTLAVRTKPNANPWRYNSLTNFNYVIQNMQANNNEYGLTTDRTKAESHMLKNMEWGAVAYLTNSKYGRCTNDECEEVAINSYSSYKTGCGPQSLGRVEQGSVCNEYNSTTTETLLVEGTGTEITITQTNDATYPWTDSSGLLSSGNNGTDSSTSTLTYTFTLSQAGFLSLDYAVSSESGYDGLTITVDSTTLVNSISGTIHGTAEASLKFDNLNTSLEAGSHTLTISYTKDSSSASGLDKAYIKNVKVLEGGEVTEVILPLGPTASTTGNVYGVYDMSGGANEYVMGNSSSAAGSYTCNVSSSSSGVNFTYDTTTAKYIDTYAYGTSYSDQTAHNRARLGDATGEVVISVGVVGGWYGSYTDFAFSSKPWFKRGGSRDAGGYAGPFVFNADEDYGYVPDSARAALLVFLD